MFSLHPSYILINHDTFPFESFIMRVRMIASYMANYDAGCESNFLPLVMNIRSANVLKILIICVFHS